MCTDDVARSMSRRSRTGARTSCSARARMSCAERVGVLMPPTTPAW
jgi:hypothetical protein